MPAIFVHVSDIHFGQEKDERVHIHTDVKEQLIADAAEVVRGLPGGIAHGILATGDIAQSGRREEYEAAGEWLDRLAEATGCEIFRIQMVPGNHDLDREKLSIGGEHILNVIRDGGSSEYEKVLANESDRASLFARFEAYGRFSEGYDCPLDTEGKLATNLHVELAPGRAVRFIRLNSALLCTGKEREENPELMIGARQFLIPRHDGEENVVLIHHPLHWFKDSEDARDYLRSRARVVISGHEHNPKISVDNVEEGCDLMMLAAGATVPFKSNETYTFTYNVIVFDWDADQDALSVAIHPRAWNPKRTRFEADEVRLGDKAPQFVLGSPNFRKCAKPTEQSTESDQSIAQSTQPESPAIEELAAAPVIEMVAAEDVIEGPSALPEVQGYRLVLLKFFRDLTEGERLLLLAELGALASDSDEPVTHGVERQLLDWLIARGRITEVEQKIEQFIISKKGRKS